MSKIFISYRRGDSKAFAGRVCDRLLMHLPRQDVFFDVSAIKGGEKFEQRIYNSIDGSDVVLAFIGADWLARSGQTDRLRICDADDYVRMELARALEKDKLIIPILIDGTPMPAPDLLPEDIRPITKRNALQLRHEAFDADLDAIMLAAAGYRLTDATAEKQRIVRRKIVGGVTGALIGLSICILGALVHVVVVGAPISITVGSGATTLLIIISGLLGGIIGWAVASRRFEYSRDDGKS